MKEGKFKVPAAGIRNTLIFLFVPVWKNMFPFVVEIEGSKFALNLMIWFCVLARFKATSESIKSEGGVVILMLLLIFMKLGWDDGILNK